VVAVVVVVVVYYGRNSLLKGFNTARELQNLVQQGEVVEQEVSS